MDIEDILDELDYQKDAYDLDGVEITEDSNYVRIGWL